MAAERNNAHFKHQRRDKMYELELKSHCDIFQGAVEMIDWKYNK